MTLSYLQKQFFAVPKAFFSYKLVSYTEKGVLYFRRTIEDSTYTGFSLLGGWLESTPLPKSLLITPPPPQLEKFPQ